MHIRKYCDVIIDMSHTQAQQTQSEDINVIESQKIFFKMLTRNKLNELLNRVTTGYLLKQINSKLKDYYAKVKLHRDCIDIYIKYYDMNDVEIGHISFHLNRKPSKGDNNYVRKGRLHAVNGKNKNRYYTFRVTQKDDLFNIHVNSPLKMQQGLEYCVNTTLKLFNKYTDKSSKYYLGNKLTKAKSTINNCLVTVAGEVEQKRYRTTYKNPHSTSIFIPKSASINAWITK